MDLSKLQFRVSSSFIPPHRTQLHPRIIHTIKTFPLQSSKDKYLIILAASLFIIPFFFYLFTITRTFHKSSHQAQLFGIVIHATPSDSTIHVFQFVNDEIGSESGSTKVRPGLAEFIGDPEGAGRSVLELVEFAKRRIPKSEWRNTKIQLLSSGDLEILGVESRDAVMESCRRVLRFSGFWFNDEWASVLKGEEEGVYGWVAVNYAVGALGKQAQQTIGIVELGGDSLQVAFAQDDPSPEQISKVIKLAGVTYNLYTKRIPHFGQDAVWESLQEHQNSRILSATFKSEEAVANSPCIRQQYDHTSSKAVEDFLPGNFSECKIQVRSLLQTKQDTCIHPPCEKMTSFFNESQGKPVPPNNFFYISKFFGVTHKGSISDLETDGRHYCEDEWHKLKDQHNKIDNLDLLRYCLSSAYLAVLLHESIAISTINKRIQLTYNHDERVHFDWTLGAFILQRMVEPTIEVADGENFGEIVGNEAVTYLSVCAVLLFAVLGVFLLLKLQKPQLKTIYDLEKGRYITTRIARYKVSSLLLYNASKAIQLF